MDTSDLYEKVFESIEQNDIEVLKRCIECNKVDINKPNDVDETILFVASKKGLHRIVKYLIEKGANLESRCGLNFTSIHIAANFGHFKCVKVLVEAGANLETRDDAYGSCPLISAVYWGWENIVQLLCIHTGPVSSLVAKFGYGPLTLAAFRGFIQIAGMLIKHGANIEERTINGATPLIATTSQGNVEMMAFLIQNGASVNAKNNSGETALFAAASFGSSEAVNILLKNRASLNKANNKADTSLHIACNRGHTDVVKILLKHGANPNREGLYLRTSLHYAALRKNSNLIQLLIQNNADVNKVDINGNTALDIQAGVTNLLSHHRSSSFTSDLTRQILHNEIINGRTTMNQFMLLCKRQFPLVRGLQNIQYQAETFLSQEQGFIQISSKNQTQTQWILVSTLDCRGCIVRVYDPFYKEPHSHETRRILASQIRFTDLDRGFLTVQVMDDQQALCERDTGLLVMAFTTDILHGLDPSSASYVDTHALKLHVNECFRTKTLIPFPRKTETVTDRPHLPKMISFIPGPRTETVTDRAYSPRTKILPPSPAIDRPLSLKQLTLSSAQNQACGQSQGQAQRQSKISNTTIRPLRLALTNKVKECYYIDLHCICHMPYDPDMAPCSHCQGYFHPVCLFGHLALPDTTANDNTKILLCFDCSPHSFRHLRQIQQPNLNNPNLKYDLFVSYSYEDMKFIKGELVKHLDRKDGHGDYDLMVCDRDWPVGGSIADTIVDTLAQSVKAIAVISNGFLNGRFTHFEWQMMVHHKPYASAVILLDRPDELDMSSYMRSLLASRIYLKWTDDPKDKEMFWHKLKKFLDKPLHQLRAEMEQNIL